MSHANPFSFLGGDLQGSLPNPIVKPDKAGMHIAGQVFGKHGIGSSTSATLIAGATSIQVASGARAYRTTNQAITNTTLTALAPDTEDFDTDNYWVSGSASRFTIPHDGKYTVGCTVLWDTSTTGNRAVYVVKNGTTGTRLAGEQMAATNGGSLNLATTLNLLAGDFIEFYVLQNSGGSVNVAGTEQISQMWIARVGTVYVPRIPMGCTWTRRGSILQVPALNGMVYVPRKSVIKGVTLLTQGVGIGNCVVDIWKAAIGSFPPNVANSITAAAPPTVLASRTYVDTTLTGWTTVLNAGDTLLFNLVSVTVFTEVACFLWVEETSA